MPAPRVLVLYNQPVLPADHPHADSEGGVLGTVRKVIQSLRRGGFEPHQLGVGREPAVLLAGLRRERPDAVFNLFEGLATHAGTEATVVGLLEWLGVPCTGSPSSALSLGLDKLRTKHLLRGAGLPTPAFVAVERLPAPGWPYGWPAIVKPARQDASVGIEQGSVVTSAEELAARCAWVLERFGPPALVEQFVPGREFHVHLIEEHCGPNLRPLPLQHVAEVLFLKQDPGYWPIYSYDAKWNAESQEWDDTPVDTAAALPPDQMQELAAMTQQAYHLVGCRDYARLDVRMTAEGGFAILEVNPNPNLNSRLMRLALEGHGRTFTELVTSLVRNALSRGGSGPAAGEGP
jgi:D-alanine-D-alanine ligase